jgi:hypothetical protein
MTSVGLIEASYAGEQSGLSTSGGADHCYHLTGMGYQGHTTECKGLNFSFMVETIQF